MTQYLTRYCLLVGCVLFLFANFVACGSKFYQVSLREDVEHTATSGNTHSQFYGIHAPKGWADLPIAFRFGNELTVEQQKFILKAIDTWEMAVGKKLFAPQGTHSGVTGDSFQDLYSSLDDTINGQYIDHDWNKTEKPLVVLATTIWNNQPDDADAIVGSDIRFNGQEYILGDSMTMEASDQQEIVDLESLALHEIGHLLGLSHVEEDVDRHSVMNAYLFIGEGLVTRKISLGDVERIQQIYGCEGSACDHDALMEKFDELEQQGEGPTVETALH